MKLAKVPLTHQAKTLTITIDENLKDCAGIFYNNKDGHHSIILKRESITILAHEIKHLAQCEAVGSLNFDKLYYAHNDYDNNPYEVEARQFERLIKSIKSQLI